MILAEKIRSFENARAGRRRNLHGRTGRDAPVGLQVGERAVRSRHGTAPSHEPAFRRDDGLSLKDELEEAPQTTESAQDSPLRRVTMQEASDYLTLRRAAAPKLALAVFLCVISPIALIFLRA